MRLNDQQILELTERVARMRKNGMHANADRLARMIKQEKALRDPKACLRVMDEYFSIIDKSEQQAFALENLKVLQAGMRLRESGYEVLPPGASLLDEFNAITDPAAKTNFYRANKGALIAEARMKKNNSPSS